MRCLSQSLFLTFQSRAPVLLLGTRSLPFHVENNACHAQRSSRPNIVFIAVDDLRPELGCYGNTHIHSPNIDRLAAQGRCFHRAYCQQSICSPSRASLLTGSRPDSIGVIENTAYFRDLNPDIVTLPEHFIAHGYNTHVYSGKIFHGRLTDDQHSWNYRAKQRVVSLARQLPGGNALPENQRIFAQKQSSHGCALR